MLEYWAWDALIPGDEVNMQFLPLSKNLRLVRYVLASVVFAGLSSPSGFGQIATAQTANSLSFENVWLRLSTASPTLRSAGHEADAAKVEANRTGRHWWPRLFADARAFTTNDAGTILFSKLATRSLTGMDLSPFAMNHPGELVFQRATIGTEFALFEGGSKIAETDFRDKVAQGRAYEKMSMTVQEYAETAAQYGSLLVLENHEAELLPIRTLVSATISSYELGARGNPVGYSGLLGLKNLRYRIEGELEMIRAHRDGTRVALSERAALPAEWRALGMPVPDFVERYLERGRNGVTRALHSTHMELAQSSLAEGFQSLKAAERARFLPRVALFAEGNLHFGNEASSTAYVVGGYLQWDLFSAPNFGAIHQAELTAAAADARVHATKLNQSVALARATRASQAVRAQMRLAEKSIVLLEEQARAARKLFLNGSINALQLTEVFSRYVDLISAKAQMASEYLKINSEMIQVVPFEIPVIAGEVQGG